MHTYHLLYFAVLLIIALLCVLQVYTNIKLNRMPYMQNWRASLLIVFLVVLLGTVICRNEDFLIPLLLAMAFSYQAPQRLIRLFFISSITCYACHLIAYSAGLLQDVLLTRQLWNGLVVLRRSLGFQHPNTVFRFFMPIFLSAYYLVNSKKSKMLYVILSLIAGVTIYVLTGSRTGLLLILIVLFLVVFWEKSVLRSRVFLRFGKYTFFMLTVLSLGLAFAGGNPNNSLNRLLTGRPYIWNRYLAHGIPVINFGQTAEMSATDLLPQYGDSLDNFFIDTLLQYGWLLFVLIGISTVYLMWKLEEAGQVKLYFIVFVYLCYGLTESSFMIASLNYSTALTMALFFNHRYFQNEAQGNSQLIHRSSRPTRGIIMGHR